MENLLKNKNIIFLFFFFNQICSIRFFLNSSFFNKDITFFYIYVALTSIVFYLMLSKKIISFFLTDKFLYFILIIFLIFLSINYPIQDDLKYIMMGSDQDNCYKDIIENIKNNIDIIYSKSYLGNPCSTGLLAFLFYFPVALWQNYFVVVPIIFLFLFNRCNFLLLKDNKLANLLTLILLTNLVFLELAVSGSDFISISISYVVANVLFIEGIKKKNSLSLLISYVFFLFFFGSRSILLILILPLAFVYYSKFRDGRILIFFSSLLILTLGSFIIPYFLMLPNYFPPFHLISKAYWYIDNVKYLIIIFLIVSVIFKKFFLIFINKNFFLIILSIVLVPFLLSSLSGFIYNLNDLSKWEELNYIFLFTPTLFICLLANFDKK